MQFKTMPNIGNSLQQPQNGAQAGEADRLTLLMCPTLQGPPHPEVQPKGLDIAIQVTQTLHPVVVYVNVPTVRDHSTQPETLTAM